MFFRLSIRTRLTPEQAGDLVASLVQPATFRGAFSFNSKDPRPFIGRASAPVFKFTRRIRYRNDFRPLVIGRVRPIDGGAVFEAVFRPALPVLVIVPVALLMLGSLAIDGVRRNLQSSSPVGGSPVAMLILLLLFLGAIVAGYVIERRKAEQILREAFDRTGTVAPQDVR